MVALARAPDDAAARRAMLATRADADALGWRVDWPA
jgi:hypothetical protein